MIVNPIHVTLPRHELEQVLRFAKHHASPNCGTSRRTRDTLQCAIDRIEAALAEADKLPDFRMFWEQNRGMNFGEARATFNAIVAEKGLDWVKDALKQLPTDDCEIPGLPVE